MIQSVLHETKSKIWIEAYRSAKDFTDWNNIPKSKTIQWKIVTDPDKIEDIPTNRNRQHLGRAQGTLFTTPEDTPKALIRY